jgi:hypothetical protein
MLRVFSDSNLLSQEHRNAALSLMSSAADQSQNHHSSGLLSNAFPYNDGLLFLFIYLFICTSIM